MEYQVGGHTIGVDAAKCGGLTLGYRDDTEYESQKQQKHYS